MNCAGVKIHKKQQSKAEEINTWKWAIMAKYMLDRLNWRWDWFNLRMSCNSWNWPVAKRKVGNHRNFRRSLFSVRTGVMNEILRTGVVLVVFRNKRRIEDVFQRFPSRFQEEWILNVFRRAKDRPWSRINIRFHVGNMNCRINTAIIGYSKDIVHRWRLSDNCVRAMLGEE